jgi:hypothetical protein
VVEGLPEQASYSGERAQVGTRSLEEIG